MVYAFSCSACGRLFTLGSLKERALMLHRHSLQHNSAILTLSVGEG